MKRAGVVVLGLLGLAVAAVVVNAHWRLVAQAAIAGSESIAYSGPRIDVRVAAGPPQPRIPLGEAGIDPAAVALAVDYAGKRNTHALLIGRGGHIVFEKYWDGFTADSMVEVSGFAPVLTALVLGSAMNDDRHLNLDTPVSNYMAEWADEPRGAITLRQLMEHDDALATVSGWPWPGSRASRFFASADLPKTLIEWPMGQGPAQFAGAPRVDSELLALLLERRFAMPYRQMLVARVWQPIGAGAFSMSANRAACCLRTRIADWMRIGELLANDGVFEGSPLTPAHYVNLLVKPAHPESPVGLFTRVDGNFVAHDVARLESAGKQRLWVVPSLKLVILRIGEEPPASQGWDEASIPDDVVRGTSGWHPVDAGTQVDPKLFAPH